MSPRTLILAALLLALVLYMAKVNADNSEQDVIQADGAGGDPTGAGAVLQKIVDVVTPSSSPEPAGMAKASLSQYAQAIYDFEDPQKNGVATRNNNPGNLKFAGQRGATGADASGFAVFPDFATGFQALINQLNLNLSRNPDYTILQDRTHYLGGDPSNPQVTGEGNPFTYAAFVAGRLGVGVTATLGQLFGGNNG